MPVNLGANKSLYGREVAQTDTSPGNLPPVWISTSFTFQYGVASNQSAASMVVDATGPVTITRISGGTQNGISWNDTLKRWEYDGVIGDPGTGVWQMRASDGVNAPVDATITGTISAQAGNLSTTFTITSAVGGTLLPFSFGHAFKEGDVNAGFIASGNTPTWQCKVKTTWPDGSAKFAVISGRATLSAGVALPITLTAATDPGGAALTTADLKATGITASIAAGAFGSASWSGTD